MTIWLSKAEKARLEGLARTWHCSPAELLQEILAQFQPGNGNTTAISTDTVRLRALIRDELATSAHVPAIVTDVVSAMLARELPTLVRALVEGMQQERATVTITATASETESVTATTNSNVTATMALDEAQEECMSGFRTTIGAARPVEDAGEESTAPATEKTAVLARLRQMRAQGLSYGKVAAQLNADGVPTLTRKGHWNPGIAHNAFR